MSSSKESPKIYDTKPDVQTLEPGCYQWCACGYSEKQPFCDGAHFRYGIMPTPLDVHETVTIAFCNCKQTKKPPYCDGAHLEL